MPMFKSLQLPLFKLTAADFTLTTDQQFTLINPADPNAASFTLYMLTRVVAVRKSGAATTACLGGIYTAAAKGGDALVAAAQSWMGLSGAAKIVDATIAAINFTDRHTQTPYLSLSTGSSAALTADVFLFGLPLD